MATQQQPVPTTSSEDGTSSYSSYSGTNSYTGQSSLTSSVQIHNYNEVDENSTIDSKPAAFENGLQSLSTTSDLIQQRILSQREGGGGEVSACSTNTKEFSLPSSFGGGARTDGSTINDTIASASSSAGGDTNDGGSSTRASASIGSRNTHQERNDLLQHQQQQQQMEVYNNNSNQELVNVDSLQLAQDDNINNNSKEDQLTIRISKETKPMMHLLRMLKEMDTNDTDTTSSADNSNNQLSVNNTNNNPKNKAISSLISDFEQEVTLIEHRIKDETKLVHYDDNNEQSSTSLVSKASSSIQPLPPNWIALEDPNSDDVYYANEVTGVTQWERPGVTTNNNNSSMNDSRSTFNDSRSTFNDSYNQSGSTLNDSYNQSGSLQGSNLSNNNNNYKQQSTTSTTFIGNVIQKSDILRNSRLANSYQDSRQSNSNFQDSQQSNNNMSSSYTNMSSSLNDSAFTSTTETTTSTNLDDNDDLPPDWIAIIDSDTGETYYANEVTGESTWEKPISHQQQPHQSVPQDDHDNVSSSNNDNDELPLGWFAAVDEQSGDTYYCNETTGETTWDRPSSSNKEVEEGVNSNNKEGVDDGTNENVNRPQDEDNDEDLPPGWFTAVDQDSGDTYYCNEATGETTWDKPTMPTTSIEETSDREQHTEDSDDHFGSSVGDNMRRLSISGDFENSDNDLPSSTSSTGLPLGWFAAVDEQSGDTYYCNEATGETTWDLPTQPAIVEDDTIASSNTNLSSNQGGGESQDGGQLPNGWFSVTDPASGDVYYCNEVTGETTWDKPTIDKATTDLLLSRTSNNVDPTVYEDDSVTSSKGY